MLDVGRQQLSEEQQAAVAAPAGPVRIVAGAGTGKTAVIAGRFRRLLEAGAEAAEILVMTFTERAAAEMHARILSDTGVAAVPHVGTFHSLAMRWLRDEGWRVGVPADFVILAGPERWIVMRELMWELGDPALVGTDRPDDLVQPLLKLLERAKQELVPVARLRAWVGRLEDPERRTVLNAALRLFRAYGARCRRDRVLDFDDLLVDAVRLLEKHTDVRARLGSRFRWVLVDEYQDTNLAQERLIELIAGPEGNVCVVGDDDQSIYRFRGASRASMDRFLTSFPSAATLQLGCNRRSTHRIVAAASRLIEHNSERLEKPLAADPDRAPGAPVEAWRCANGDQEAAAIAAEAGAAHAAGIPLRRIAVLARTHAIARPIAAALVEAGVPFQHLAGQGLFRRPEVRDLVAYLRLLQDPTDLVALARLLVRPPLELNLTEAMPVLRAGEAPRAPLRALQAWAPTANWATLVAELSALKMTLGVDELLFELLSRTRHLDVLLGGLNDVNEARRVAANVSRFGELVDEYCDRRRDHSLRLFVEHLDLVLRSGLDEDEAELDDIHEAVQLMTIHQAKGLEFDLVFVPAMVEGRLPQPRRREEITAVAGLELPAQLLEPAARGREDQLAEERRLCYVAMTRARERLVLTWAERYEGERVWRRSRFLDELGPAAVEYDRRCQTSSAAAAPTPRPASGPGSGPADQDSQGEKCETEVALSFSAISAYRECPRQHWYRYRLRLPAPSTDEGQLGTVIHLALQRAGRLRRDGMPLTLKALSDLHQEAWGAVALVEPRRRRSLEALSWRLLERFLDEGGLDPPPRLVESPFTVALDGWTLRGVIDRADAPLEAGAPWRIVDYKTGSPLPASRLRRDLQLALYALGARTALGLNPIELEIVYLKDGRRVTLPAGEELLSGARTIAGAVADGVRAGRFEPRPERRRCARCAYRLVCEAAL